jgi:hypothetical protein
MYELVLDLDRGLMRVGVFGLLEAADVKRFALEHSEGARKLTKVHGKFDLLIVLEVAVQPQQAAAAVKAAADEATMKASKVAIVGKGQLLKMQIKRVAGTARDMAFFEDVASAEAWLSL